ncbi:hypothetical protein ACVOMV_24865 [Mesorhizobium atlanticum]
MIARKIKRSARDARQRFHLDARKRRALSGKSRCKTVGGGDEFSLFTFGLLEGLEFAKCDNLFEVDATGLAEEPRLDAVPGESFETGLERRFGQFAVNRADLLLPALAWCEHAAKLAGEEGDRQ